jgi:hypothetical protein
MDSMNTDLHHQMYQSMLAEAEKSVAAERLYRKAEAQGDTPGISVVETMASHQEQNYFSGLGAPLKSTRSTSSDFASTYDLLRSRSRAASPTQGRENGHPQHDGAYPFDENKLKKYFKEITSGLGANPDARSDARSPATISHIRHDEAPIAAYKPDPFRTIASFSRDASRDPPRPALAHVLTETASIESRRWLEQELESARTLAMQQVPPLPPPPPAARHRPAEELPTLPAPLRRLRRRRGP